MLPHLLKLPWDNPRGSHDQCGVVGELFFPLKELGPKLFCPNPETPE